MPEKPYRCWCCGQDTLVEEPTGTYEICGNCGWEDDPVQSADPDYEGGANRLSLRKFRRHVLQEEALHVYWRAGNAHGQPITSVRIPGGSPVSLDDGADWVGSRIVSGSRVGWRVRARGSEVVIWLKHWENGDPEPDFPADAGEASS